MKQTDIHINGRERQVPEGASITAILGIFELQATTVVVEHNGEVLSRERFDEIKVDAGDRLEIVRFVGGGSR